MRSTEPVTKRLTDGKCVTKSFGIRVTCVVFGYDGNDLFVLLRKRPINKVWALPGDVPRLGESLHDAVIRICENYLPGTQTSPQQVFTFGDVRFTRRRWITVAYSTLMNMAAEKKPSVPHTEWFPINRRPMLGYTEEKVVEKSLEMLRTRIRHEPIGISLLPKEFTLKELQKAYELLLGQPISREKFRKKMWDSEILIPLEETITETGRSQPRGLYRFNKKKYLQLKRNGFFLDL